MYDLIIIGAGPAGLAAAVYARRARLDFVVLEKEGMGGGQIIETDEVDNYPGFPQINGYDLAVKLQEHAEKLGARILCDEVTGISDPAGEIKTVHGRRRDYSARTLILAAGASHRRLGVPGEERLAGQGVSYCAVCDGAFYRGQQVAVMGGGNVAVEDALFLSRICRKVYLIHRRGELRAAADLREQIRDRDNVEILWNTVLREIQGDEEVEGLRLAPAPGTADAGSGEWTLPVDGVFIAVGIAPNTGILGEAALALDPDGFVPADESCVTACPGIFAAGDIRTKPLRQVVTAAADGANAAVSAERYLNQKKQEKTH